MDGSFAAALFLARCGWYDTSRSRALPTKKSPTVKKTATAKKTAVKRAPATKKSATKKAAAQAASQPAAQPEIPQPEPMWKTAVAAADAKQARDIKVIDLRPVTSFADFFVICTGSNSRQVHAISDEVGVQLKKLGEMPSSIEGHRNADWVLMDYGDYVVHIFSEQARSYYDLERLWRDAPVVYPTA